MVNSGSFDSDGDRSAKGEFTQQQSAAESPQTQSATPLASVCLCEHDFTTQTAGSLPLSHAIEPTATRTEFKCKMPCISTENRTTDNNTSPSFTTITPHINTTVFKNRQIPPFYDPLSAHITTNNPALDERLSTTDTDKPALYCRVPLDKIQSVLTQFINNTTPIVDDDLAKSPPSTDEAKKLPSPKTPKKILCLYCDRTFVTPNLKQKHVDRCHSVSFNRRLSTRRLNATQNSSSCMYCNDLDDSDCNLRQLFEHLIANHPAKYFGCLDCETRFSNAEHLKEHALVAHDISPDSTSELSVEGSDEPSNIWNRFDSGASRKSTRARINNAKSKGSEVKADPEDEVAVKTEEDLEISAKPEVIDASVSVTVRIGREVRGTTAATRKSDGATNKKMVTKQIVRTTRLRTRLLESAKNAKKQMGKTRKSEPGIATAKPPVQKAPFTNRNRTYSAYEFLFHKVKKITDHSIDNLRIGSMTFEDVFDQTFYNKVKCNIRENLLNHIDGKLFNDIESESRISAFEKGPQCQPEVQNFTLNNDSYACDNISINAVAPVATLLTTAAQFGEDLESQIEYGCKASKKKCAQSDQVHYKYFTRRKYQAIISESKKHNRDLSRLDMWTQLVVKNRQHTIIEQQKTGREKSEYAKSDEYRAKMQVEELDRILDQRAPYEDLREEVMRKVALDKFHSEGTNVSPEDYFDVSIIVKELINNVLSNISETDEFDTIASDLSINNGSSMWQEEETADDRQDIDIPDYLNLSRNMNSNDQSLPVCENFSSNKDELAELTGEWARSKIYLCASCGTKLPNAKALVDHKNLFHQNVWCQHYEFVGNQSELYKHLSIPGLGKIGELEDSLVSKAWGRSDARVCTKCNKRCNCLGDLHRHLLECGGDWTWMLVRKKYKYRPYGAKTRRKRRGLGLMKLWRLSAGRKREDSMGQKEKKKMKKRLQVPRTKPSDAESIQRMLANLPAKRTRRKIISLKDGQRTKVKDNAAKQKLAKMRLADRAREQRKKDFKLKRNKRLLRSSNKLIDSKMSSSTSEDKQNNSNETTKKLLRKRRPIKGLTNVLSSKILKSSTPLIAKRMLRSRLKDKNVTEMEKIKLNKKTESIPEEEERVEMSKNEKLLEKSEINPEDKISAKKLIKKKVTKKIALAVNGKKKEIDETKKKKQVSEEPINKTDGSIIPRKKKSPAKTPKEKTESPTVDDKLELINYDVSSKLNEEPKQNKTKIKHASSLQNLSVDSKQIESQLGTITRIRANSCTSKFNKAKNDIVSDQNTTTQVNFSKPTKKVKRKHKPICGDNNIAKKSKCVESKLFVPATNISGNRSSSKRKRKVKKSHQDSNFICGTSNEKSEPIIDTEDTFVSNEIPQLDNILPSATETIDSNEIDAEKPPNISDGDIIYSEPLSLVPNEPEAIKTEEVSSTIHFKENDLEINATETVVIQNVKQCLVTKEEPGVNVDKTILSQNPKPARKIKKPLRGLNDCIAMLASKLGQNFSDKTNVFDTLQEHETEVSTKLIETISKENDIIEETNQTEDLPLEHNQEEAINLSMKKDNLQEEEIVCITSNICEHSVEAPPASIITEEKSNDTGFTTALEIESTNIAIEQVENLEVSVNEENIQTEEHCETSENLVNCETNSVDLIIEEVVKCMQHSSHVEEINIALKTKEKKPRVKAKERNKKIKSKKRNSRQNDSFPIIPNEASIEKIEPVFLKGCVIDDLNKVALPEITQNGKKLASNFNGHTDNFVLKDLNSIEDKMNMFEDFEPSENENRQPLTSKPMKTKPKQKRKRKPLTSKKRKGKVKLPKVKTKKLLGKKQASDHIDKVSLVEKPDTNEKIETEQQGRSTDKQEQERNDISNEITMIFNNIDESCVSTELIPEPENVEMEPPGKHDVTVLPHDLEASDDSDDDIPLASILKKSTITQGLQESNIISNEEDDEDLIQKTSIINDILFDLNRAMGLDTEDLDDDDFSTSAAEKTIDELVLQTIEDVITTSNILNSLNNDSNSSTPSVADDAELNDILDENISYPLDLPVSLDRTNENLIASEKQTLISDTNDSLLKHADEEKSTDEIRTNPTKKKSVKVRKGKATKGKRKAAKTRVKINEAISNNEESTFCEICNKSFAKIDNLTKHKSTLKHIEKLSRLEVESLLKPEEVTVKNEDLKDTHLNVENRADVLDEEETWLTKQFASNNELYDADKSPANSLVTNYTSSSLSSRDGLKLADIINDVLSKPVDSEMSKHDNFSDLILQKGTESSRRCRSLGERKSFSTDRNLFPDPNNEESLENLKDSNVEMTSFTLSKMSVTADSILEKQISLLENMIEENCAANKNTNTVFDRSKMYTDENSFSSDSESCATNNLKSESITFSHDTNIVSRLIVPEFSESNLLSSTNYDEISEDNTLSSRFEEQNSRKTLNTDEALFLECCSLLKGSSEISSASKNKTVSLLSTNSQNKVSTIKHQIWPDDYAISNTSSKDLEPNPQIDVLAPFSKTTNDTMAFYNNRNVITSNWNSPIGNEIPDISNKTEDFSDMSMDDDKDSAFMEQLTNRIENYTGRSIHEMLQDNFVSKCFPMPQEKIVDKQELEILDDENNTTKDQVTDDKSKKRKKKSINSTCVDQPAITNFIIPTKQNEPQENGKKILTKGAMKVFEGLKVSIPKEGLDMEEVLNCSPTSKRMELQSESENFSNIPISPPKPPLKKITRRAAPKPKSNQNRKRKVFSAFGNELGLRVTKRKQHVQKSTTNKTILEANTIHDIYDFEETQDNTDLTLNATTLPDYKSYKSMAEYNKQKNTNLEAQLDIYEEDKLTSNQSDEKSTKKFDLETCSVSSFSISSANSLKRNNSRNKLKNYPKKKCVIMGRIFKNALKSKYDSNVRDIPPIDNSKLVENYILNCQLVQQSEGEEVVDTNMAQNMSVVEMNKIFDKLLTDEKPLERTISKETEEKLFKLVDNPTASSNKKKVARSTSNNSSKKAKKRPKRNYSDSKDEDFCMSRSTKRRLHKNLRAQQEERVINLEQELKECIGVAGRKSQRKCTSGKQNVLVEYWSSDESNSDLINFDDAPQNTKTAYEQCLENESPENVKIEDNIKIEENIVNKFESQLSPIPDFQYDWEEDIKPEPIEQQISKDSEDEEESSVLDKRKKKTKSKDPKCVKSVTVNSIATTRRKRSTTDTLYYWSSSSEDEYQEMMPIKSARDEDDDDDEGRPLQHGWIVGDSPKKLVTLLAHAKGKKVDVNCVKQQQTKRRTSNV